MYYSDFTLEKVQKAFDLTISEDVDLFANVPELEPSALLTEFLQDNAQLALKINTEKARSEMIIAPILLDLRKQVSSKISLFSGVDFNVDIERGLNGTCDYIISKSPEQLFLKSPVIVLVEAKKENIGAGIGQCASEMLAAQLFNDREGNQIPVILGVVTSGNIWRFLELSEKHLRVDATEYYLKDINKVLGIFANQMQ
ncbi:hypothetical protein [Microcoleus sp. bin38.metabat.b11b12b14.051]|uniref:hypothetical protein n=1 Tax=Microcoleus sp. bin38.metabat.b11b12b14.051 TaxID=2742709 RepID=UPI0025E591A6|nr:hypothetical protein [Microcoleus sp. bin38.metabat.b11b12b14.051]